MSACTVLEAGWRSGSGIWRGRKGQERGEIVSVLAMEREMVGVALMNGMRELDWFEQEGGPWMFVETHPDRAHLPTSGSGYSPRFHSAPLTGSSPVRASCRPSPGSVILALGPVLLRETS